MWLGNQETFQNPMIRNVHILLNSKVNSNTLVPLQSDIMSAQYKQAHTIIEVLILSVVIDMTKIMLRKDTSNYLFIIIQ